MTFREFASTPLMENEIPTIQSSPDAFDITHADNRDDLNLALIDAFEHPLLTIESGYEKIRTILFEAGFDFLLGLHIPSSDAEEGEDIYIFDEHTDIYLYVAFFQDEQGFFEFHAEVVTEEELDEILSIE